MELYNRFLREIEKKIGNGTTNTGQIEKIGKKLFGKLFEGVFASDQLQYFKGPFGIANLDTTWEPGTHWVSLYKLPCGKVIIYDSFGRNVLKNVKDRNFLC